MPVHDGVSAVNISSSASITTANKAGLLFGYVLKGGTTGSSLILRNGGASGTILWEDFIKAQTNAGDDGVRLTFSKPIVFSTDIYATLAGTNAEACVSYKEIG